MYYMYGIYHMYGTYFFLRIDFFPEFLVNLYIIYSIKHVNEEFSMFIVSEKQYSIFYLFNLYLYICEL